MSLISAHELPLPEPTAPREPLTAFKSLSFDIYGTLIDWETGMVRGLKPLLDSAAEDHPFKHALSSTDAKARLAARFHEHESRLNAAQPTKIYSEILAETYRTLARNDFSSILQDEVLDADAQRFGRSVGEWPAFPDTVEAMQRLEKRYKLVPLSNVDRASFVGTCEGPLSGVHFWQSFVASEIGSYKPELRNFKYLLEHVDKCDKAEGGPGIAKEENLHVAQSLFHDHGPAKIMGLSSVWIARKGAGYGVAEAARAHENGEVGYGWRFGSLRELADEVDRQWNGES